jgi:hypothetical protein
MTQTETFLRKQSYGTSGCKQLNTQDMKSATSDPDQRFSFDPQARLCPKGICLLLSGPGEAAQSISDWADSQDATLMVINERKLPLDWLLYYAPHFDFLLIDADFMGDTEETVDLCLRIRRTAPFLPQIVLSSDVRSHDLTCERMMVCDVTLKAPIQAQMLTLGVQTAYENHAYFYSRRS